LLSIFNHRLHPNYKIDRRTCEDKIKNTDVIESDF
jgi:hypothetical protein